MIGIYGLVELGENPYVFRSEILHDGVENQSPFGGILRAAEAETICQIDCHLFHPDVKSGAYFNTIWI